MLLKTVKGIIFLLQVPIISFPFSITFLYHLFTFLCYNGEMKKHQNTSGFSLVELSIVMLIAGLLVAGITSGAHLMQAAKLNKIISEITGYVTATNNFKDKYRAWPGDMPNATSYWGTYSAGPPITGATNGNGDEKITEDFQAWRQMALAGMISGSYTGVTAGATSYQAGVNMPASSIEGAYYQLYHWGPYFGTTGLFLALEKFAANDAGGGALTPSDTHIIDVKIDNGIASTGNVYGHRGSDYIGASGKCVDADFSAASANYILTDTATSCRLFYWITKQ